MIHAFDVDIAAKYGVNCAILLNNFQFWIEKNRANGVNFHDGYYWTYNSAKALAELFPYMSTRQITSAIQKLKDEGLLITGNYNKSAYDRTLWYAITEKGESILQKCEPDSAENGKSIMQKCEMDLPEMENGLPENGEPIPDIKADIKADIKKDNKPRTARLDVDEIFSRYTKDEKTLALLHDWLDVRKAKRAPKTERALTANLDKLQAVAKASGMTVNAYLEAIIMRGWAAFYEIQQYGSQKQQYRRPYDNPTAHLTAKDHENDVEFPW